MKSAIKTRIAAALLATAMGLGAGAAGVGAHAGNLSTPSVKVNGSSYKGDVKLIDGVTYVKVREFSEGLGARVTWDGKNARAIVSSSEFDLTLGCKDNYLTTNGSHLRFKGESFVINERIYVPLRAIGSAFGLDTSWNSHSFSATLSRRNASPSVPKYSEDDLYWLAKIISAEAEGESFEGKLAVGSVVLNRVRSSEFPSTVYGVIFDRKNGVQFTPVANGEIYGKADSESILAAKRCLEGGTVSDEILFFMNARLSDSFWIPASRRYVMTIGNHDFYA